MDYRFSGDFNKCPTGPFTAANKKLVWSDPASAISFDADSTGKYYSIVADDRFPGGRAQRQLYPKGEHGTNAKQYQVRYKSPQTICNLEYLMCFEPGFSFFTPTSGSKQAIGKIGPQMNWGEVGGPDDKRGTRAMWLWNGANGRYPSVGICPAGQDQRTGNPLVSPPVYGPKIVTDQIYKLRTQMKGGPGGFMKWWLDDQLVAEEHGDYKATAQDDMLFDFAFWSGGASAEYAPEHDSYARCGGVRMWSGEAYWASDTAPPDTGNGDGDTGAGGGDTGPTPPSGATSAFSLAVGETRIFRARFLDTSVSPAQEIPATGDIKWQLSPNNVKWGKQAGPHWSAIEVVGQKAGKCTLVATDPATGISTLPVTVDITTTPEDRPGATGFCTVEPVSGGA